MTDDECPDLCPVHVRMTFVCPLANALSRQRSPTYVVYGVCRKIKCFILYSPERFCVRGKEWLRHGLQLSIVEKPS